MIVAEQSSVVEVPKIITLVASPQSFVVTEISADVTVVSTGESTVVTVDGIDVVPVQVPVTVVASMTTGSSDGPKIYVQSTPPSGAALNDVWIRTA